MPTERPARLSTRALLVLALFAPAPVISAFPGLAPWLAADWGGLPASAYLGVAYIGLFMALTARFARAAGSEG